MNINKNNADELKAKILIDARLSEWFFDLCIGRKPSIEVSEDVANLMEKYEIIKKTDAGFELGKSGIEFGRNLGLIRGENPIEFMKELLGDLGEKKVQNENSNNQHEQS